MHEESMYTCKSMTLTSLGSRLGLELEGERERECVCPKVLIYPFMIIYSFKYVGNISLSSFNSVPIFLTFLLSTIAKSLTLLIITCLLHPSPNLLHLCCL